MWCKDGGQGLNIVQFSGGKDSTCMLLMMLEKGIDVDYIIFCDTGKEFPQMYRHIEKVNDYIFTKYGKTITTLKAEHSFDYYFLDYVKKKGKRKGKQGYGWCTMRNRWCTHILKHLPCRWFLRDLGIDDYTLYIGIAYDEPKRTLNKPSNVVHPLFEWGITEKDALEYCYSKGFDWEGLYEIFNRVSCWCCPLQLITELRNLRKHFPELWKELLLMDNKLQERERERLNFKNSYTVQELEDRFAYEERNGIKQKYRKSYLLKENL